MRLTDLLAAAAVATMIAAPAMAQPANPAAKLSLAPTPAGAAPAMPRANKRHGGSSTLIIVGVAAAAVIGIALAAGHSDSKPASS
jgi:hypothetical protein